MTTCICCSLESLAAEAVSAHDLSHCPAPSFHIIVVSEVLEDEPVTASIVCVAGVVAMRRIKWVLMRWIEIAIKQFEFEIVVKNDEAAIQINESMNCDQQL